MDNAEMTDAVVTRLQQGKERIAIGWCKGYFRQINTQTGTEEVCARGAVREENMMSGQAVAIDVSLGPVATAAEWALSQTIECNSHNDEILGGFEGVVARHNNECLANQAAAIDWFERAIRWTKEHIV